MKITADIRRLCTDDETYRMVRDIVRADEALRMAKAQLSQYNNRHRQPNGYPKVVKNRDL